MSERKPQFKPTTNIPVSVQLVKFFGKGTNEFGTWFGWNIKVNGEEFSWFPPESVHKDITGMEGQTIVVCLKEKKNEAGKAYKTYEVVTKPLFDEKGSETPEPPPNLATNPEAYQTFRDEWKKKFREAIDDAYEVLAEFNANPLYELKFTAEDVRTAAISRMIDYTRKTK